MEKRIRIGTRESQLAVWQAQQVKALLEQQGNKCKLVFISSDGDIDLKTPLYKVGIQGIFTKTLDMALLAGQIDIAVHSYKDVPTEMAEGIMKGAVLPRGSHADVLVPRQAGESFLDEQMPYSIATSSIRRKAQWLHKFPNSSIENLRGNVNTRLQKLADSQWHGAIFAAAGLQRIGLLPAYAKELTWMLPAPAQGAIVVVCRANDTEAIDALRPLDDAPTAACTAVERDFLRALAGGCSTPISALAEIESNDIVLKGNVFSPDGLLSAHVEKRLPIATAAAMGDLAAIDLLEAGGKEILEQMKHGQ
jgi:hydroxymethylbilane synthase